MQNEGPFDAEDTPERRLAKLDLALPDLMKTTGCFELTAVDRGLVFVSGHVPWDGSKFIYRGKIGRDFDILHAQEIVQHVVLGCLASLKVELGELSRVRRVLKMVGLLNCMPDFEEPSKIMDAGSRLLLAVFGDRGMHARSAIGVATLPHGVAVEIEMVVAID